jgi:hypothetical protein
MVRQRPISVGAPLAQEPLRQQRCAPTSRVVGARAANTPLSVGAPLAHLDGYGAAP